MAKKIVDETLKFTVVINGDSAQKEYGQLERANKKIIESIKDYEKELKKLSRAKKANAAEIEALTKKQQENNKTLTANKARMSDLTKEIGINNLTTKQLAATNRKLQLQMKELDPNTSEWKALNSQLTSVKSRQGELRSAMSGTSKAMGQQTGFISKLKNGFKSIVFPISGALLFADALKSGLQFTKQFIQDSVKLAIEAKGVEFAFKALGKEGELAFNKVKASTRGLLSDLEIKKSLVEFNNFNISLEETDTLFEFLAVRATQTGQSVDKLKASLVEGLSKESKLRIDNLGISTAALNEELSRTPNFVQAVANIAKSEVAKAGSILDDAASSSQRWNATLENTKLQIGNIITGSGAITFFQKLGASVLQTVFPLEKASEATEKQRMNLLLLNSKVKDVNTSQEERLKIIREFKEKYPSFLANIDAEKVTNEQLTTAIRAVNNQLINKIVLLEKEEELKKQNKKEGEQELRAIKQEDKLRRQLTKVADKYNFSLKEGATLAEQTQDFIDKHIDNTERMVRVNIRSLSFELNSLKNNAAFLKNQQTETARILSEREALKKRLGISDEILNGPVTEDKDPKKPELTDEEKEKALAALKDFERRKLDFQNEAALKAAADDFARKELKIQQDAIASQKEIDALKISSAKKQELTTLLEADKNTKLNELNSEREAKELERLQSFENQKRELENQIALSKANSNLERELLKAEQDAEKEALEIERLTFNEEQKASLLADLETQKLLNIQAIKEKFRLEDLKKQEEYNQKQIEAEQNLEEARQKSLQAGVSALADAFDKKTVIGKLAFLFQKGMAIQEIVIATAKANAIIASSLAAANTAALVYGPVVAPLIIGANTAIAAKNTTANNLIAGVQIAAIVGSAIQGFEEGLYPITRKQDGKVYNSRISTNTGTQIANQPTVLVGERPEMVIDPNTFKRMDPKIIDYIMALAGKPTMGYEKGLYNTNNSQSTQPINNDKMSGVLEMVMATMSSLNQTLQGGIKATTLYGPEEEIKRRNVSKTIDNLIKESKN
ncbi:hypothetical protein [Lacinutrix sp. Hel_I_90]|uniref:hypothetical protein n=1 Tax=Lacinutrix sp. Hel_I_90 TaxID=1249999 RepID=UPI0005CA7D02|nr:hypothetical protein [Lacinutrix sp. Hel_I_90]